MASQRDPARWRLFITVGAIDLVVGVLLLAVNLGPFMDVIAAVVGLAGLLMLLSAIRGYRRERHRVL